MSIPKTLSRVESFKIVRSNSVRSNSIRRDASFALMSVDRPKGNLGGPSVRRNTSFNEYSRMRPDKDLSMREVSKPTSKVSCDGGSDSAKDTGLSGSSENEARLRTETKIDEWVKSELEGKSVTQFYALVEDLIKTVESVADKEQAQSLSRGRKIIYAAAVLLAGIGGSSSVLGLLPLGADATSRERAIGISQFILAIAFSHGAPYMNAMHNLVGRLDSTLTDYFQSTRDADYLSSIGPDIKQALMKACSPSGGLTVLAVLIAAFSPMLDAINSREGGINLVSGGDPSLMPAGVVVGNFLMCCNWLAGSSLILGLANNLFRGILNDIENIGSGALYEQSEVESLVKTLRQIMLTKHSLDADLLQLIANPVTSEYDLLVHMYKKFGESLDHESLDQKLPKLIDLLDDGLKTALKAKASKTQGAKGKADAAVTECLISELSGLLKSPKLWKRVQKLLSGEPVTYSDIHARLKALATLLIRIGVLTAAGSCIAVTVATPMVTNYYKAFGEDPTQPVDCRELKNISGEGEIALEFKMGLVAYLLQGISLSDGIIQELILMMTPLTLLITLISDRALDRARLSCKKLIRDFPAAAAVCGAICGAVMGWVLFSADSKYQEYRELLDCDIGVPETILDWAGEHAPIVTLVLMVGTIGHLGFSSFDSIFRKLGLVSCSRRCGTAPEETRRKEPGDDSNDGAGLHMLQV